MLVARKASIAVAFIAGTVLLTACGSPGSSSFLGPSVANPERAHGLMVGDSGSGSGSSKIQHVVILVQENRSLNNLFMGYPGAKTKDYGYISTGQKIKLKPITLEANFIPGYGLKDFFTQCNGTGSIPGTNCRMNGFDQVAWQCGNHSCPIKYPPYSYVERSEVQPYWDIAKQYVLADQMYASNIDESSFISHQYIISAQAMQSYNWPNSETWGCEGGPAVTIPELGQQRQPVGKERVCFADLTLGQEADNAGVSWNSYSAPIGPRNGGGWNGYQANEFVYYGSDWKNNIVENPAKFLTDVSKGKLRQITWITPTLVNSDHPENHSNTGPMWVASLVNTIGKSKFWNSTAIFVLWDDPSGFYDPEPPPYVDYDGLGFRLPLLVISPYAKQGYVSHVQYEHGSILKFAEDIFGLPRLSASDTRANSPAADCFDFTKPPRKFKKIPSKLDAEYFIRQPLDTRPVDTQ